MKEQDYIFADVGGIDIMGEVLPQHDTQGMWRPERAEDWAFLAEAWGERSLIRYKDSSRARTQAEVEAKMAEIKSWGFMQDLRVAERSKYWSLLRRIEEMLNEPYDPRWCACVPAERSWEDGDSDLLYWNWYERCPDMLPARQLHVPIKHGMYVAEPEYYRWETERLRSAYADMAANQLYVCENWYDEEKQKSRTNEGRIYDGRFDAYYHAYTTPVRRWVDWIVPDAPTLTLPEGAGTPTLAALFHVSGGRQQVNRWQLKTVAPEGITTALLESMAPPADDEDVTISMVKTLLIVPMSMRTKLN